MSIDKELLQKIKTLEIKTRRAVQSTFSGEYHSLFKGQGMSFSDVREYQPGDEIRTIDWKVSARLGSPYIKRFEEERELSVILAVDKSKSVWFGSTAISKDQIAAELSAILGFSAISNNDRVGLLLFSDQVEQFIPPKKGKKHMFRLLRELFYFEPKNSGTSLETALTFLSKGLKKKSIIFIISDFLDTGYDSSLKLLSKKHECVPIILEDPKEKSLPKAGLIALQDPESGEHVFVNTYSKDIRQRFRNMVLSQKHYLDRLFKSSKIFPITLNITLPYLTHLERYFKLRIQHLRRGI